MPDPYNYTFDLPKPPADTFLQDIVGIQQLKMGRQQAEIQKQQAEFQKQKQPLEINQLTEQINSAKAAQASAYASAAESKARTGLVGVQKTAAQENLTALQEKNKLASLYQNKVIEMANSPTSWTQDDLKSLKMLATGADPQAVAGIEKFGKDEPTSVPLLTEAASYVAFAANSGKPQLIVPKLEQYVSAVEEKLKTNPNDNVSKIQLEALKKNLETAKTDPDAAGVEALVWLSSFNNTAFDNFTKAVKVPQESTRGQVEIKDVFTKDLIAKSVEKSTEYTKKSDLAYGILEKIDTGEIKLPENFVSRWIQKEVKDVYPLFANEITALKKDFIKIKNSEAAKNLPPGSASNQDVQFAKEGLTSENASPEQFRKAVEAMGRLYQLDSKYEEAKAAWLSANGNLGNSRQNISVLGMDVTKGSGFNQWWKTAVSELIPPPETSAPSGPQNPPGPPSRRKSTLPPTPTDKITGTPPIAPTYAPPAGVTIKSVR
jgi:hypothetical protein